MSLDHAAADVLLTIGAFPVPEQVADMDDAVSAWRTLCEAKRQLSASIEDMAHAIGEAAPDARKTDENGKRLGTLRFTAANVTLERHARGDSGWKCTDEDGLWRLVLDTRIVDEATGEVLPTHEVVRRAYGSESRETGKLRLTGASPSKVKALGIDPSDFFERGRFIGWSLREHSA